MKGSRITCNICETWMCYFTMMKHVRYIFVSSDIWRGHVSLATHATYECVISQGTYLYQVTMSVMICMHYVSVESHWGDMWDRSLCLLTYDDIWRGHVSLATYVKHECVLSQRWDMSDTYLYQVTMGVEIHISISNLNLLGLFSTEHGKRDLEN